MHNHIILLGLDRGTYFGKFYLEITILNFGIQFFTPIK